MSTVLITGGSAGIGRAIALKMAEEGHQVMFNYSRDDAKAEETLAECLRFHSRVAKFKADVCNEVAVETMFHAVESLFGPVDIVINNAGRNIDKPLLEMSAGDWDQVVDVNMKGVFLVSRCAAEHMTASEVSGHIINIAASTGITGRRNGLNYCASKAGVIVMTKCMAMELGPSIRVNCVIPGITRTDEIEERFNLKENEADEIRRRDIPLGRIGETGDVANLISFLISDKAAYLNGQKFIVNGGEYMY